MALYKQLSTRKDKHDFYNKYVKDKKFDWVQKEQRHEASSSTDKRAVEGWMTRFQIADHEKMPVGHSLLVSKLAGLPSHAHSQLEWKGAGEMECY